MPALFTFPLAAQQLAGLLPARGLPPCRRSRHFPARSSGSGSSPLHQDSHSHPSPSHDPAAAGGSSGACTRTFGKFLCTALCPLAISFAICQAGLWTHPGSGSAHPPQQDDGLLLDPSSIRSVTGQPDVHRWSRASIPLKCHLKVVHLTVPVELLHLSENWRSEHIHSIRIASATLGRISKLQMTSYAHCKWKAEVLYIVKQLPCWNNKSSLQFHPG